MKKTAKSSKTIRANKRKAKLKVKHRRQRERGPPDEPGWQGSMLAPSENPVTRRGYHYRGQPGPTHGKPLPGRSSKSGSGTSATMRRLQADPQEFAHPLRRLASCLRSETHPALRAICAVLLLLVVYSRPASCEVPELTWLLANRVAIQVFDCSGLPCGKIVWLARPRTQLGGPMLTISTPIRNCGNALCVA